MINLLIAIWVIFIFIFVLYGIQYFTSMNEKEDVWYQFTFIDDDYHITIAKNDKEAIEKSKEFENTCIKIEQISYPYRIVYEREN